MLSEIINSRYPNTCNINETEYLHVQQVYNIHHRATLQQHSASVSFMLHTISGLKTPENKQILRKKPATKTITQYTHCTWHSIKDAK